MKFDTHLAAYLYEHKLLKLEGLGTFTLDDKVRVPYEQGKEVYYPIEGLHFYFDPKADTDENIIIYLVNKLRKIEPLVRSDLEFYLSNIKVLLNIGNPYTIEGVGTLIRNNDRVYEFTPGNFLPAKEELNPKRENAEHNYPKRSEFSAGKFFVTLLIVIAALAALGGIGWGILNFTTKRLVTNQVEMGRVDSDTQAPVKDTLAAKAIAVSNNTIGKGDTSSYKMIFEITKSKERAHIRTEQLNRLNSPTQYDSIPIDDSTAYFRLFLNMRVAATDTTHIKDSLRTFFGRRIFIEKQTD